MPIRCFMADVISKQKEREEFEQKTEERKVMEQKKGEKEKGKQIESFINNSEQQRAKFKTMNLK